MRRGVLLTSEIETLVNQIMERTRSSPSPRGQRLAGILNVYRKWCLTDTYLLHAHLARASLETSDGAIVLDAGAGQQQYRWLFNHARYVSCDFGRGEEAWNYTGIDVLCDLEAIPYRSDHFDVCILTEVLEHLARPELVVKEVARVLRPGGRLYITVPFAFPEHQMPHDYHRYTSVALRRLAEISGLVPSEVVMRTGLAVFFAYYLDVAFDSWMNRFRCNTGSVSQNLCRAAKIIGRFVLSPIKAVLYWIDHESAICVGFNCVFTKL